MNDRYSEAEISEALRLYARRGSRMAVGAAVDGRSLRATGRTEHLNFKALPMIRKLIEQHVPKGSRSLWLEEAIIAKLKAEGALK